MWAEPTYELVGFVMRSTAGERVSLGIAPCIVYMEEMKPEAHASAPENSAPSACPAEKGPIYVTRAVLPPAEVYKRYLDEVFDSGHLTNEGRFAVQLEKELAARFDVPYFSLCTNGTLSLQLALRLKGLQGREVITTPFTYVATASALLWEGCTPVFADVDEETLCLSPKAVEEALSDATAGILPVHIYGNACDVEGFAALSAQYNLACIYDAAQAVGSAYKGKSLLAYGDAAICSFHATKVFHTVEGGGVVVHNAGEQRQVGLLRAFGHRGDEHYGLGINAKLSELHAVMGLALLPQLDANIRARKRVTRLYDACFPVPGLRRPVLREGLDYNYSYYPVLFDDPAHRERAVARMNEAGIYPRRYFSPAVNTIEYMPVKKACPVAEDAARRTLCLPLYAELPEQAVERIIRIIKKSLTA